MRTLAQSAAVRAYLSLKSGTMLELAQSYSVVSKSDSVLARAPKADRQRRPVGLSLEFCP